MHMDSRAFPVTKNVEKGEELGGVKDDSCCSKLGD